MDAMMCIILIAALILTAGSVACFEAPLPRNLFSQPFQSSPGQRDFRSEAERKAQPASVNTPAPVEIALMSAAFLRSESVQVMVERQFLNLHH
jgi:hypothetical protein